MKAITWAIEQSHLDPIPFKLLMMLASRVGKQNFHVWPSYKTMGEDAHISASSAKKYIAELAELGLVSKVGQRWRPDKGRSSNVYNLNVASTPIIEADNEEEDGFIDFTPLSSESRGYGAAETGGLGDCATGIEPLSSRTSIIEDTPPLPSEVWAPHGTEQLNFVSIPDAMQMIARPEPIADLVIKQWKAIAEQDPGIAGARGLDESRKRAITARGRDGVKLGFQTEHHAWQEIFTAIGRSEFLRGLAPPGRGRSMPFRLTLDFVLKPNNFRKIIEGGFDDRHDARTSDAVTGRHYGPAEQAARAVERRLFHGGQDDAGR